MFIMHPQTKSSNKNILAGTLLALIYTLVGVASLNQGSISRKPARPEAAFVKFSKKRPP